MKKEIVFDIKAWVLVAIVLPVFSTASSWQQNAILSLATCILLICLFYPHQWLLKTFLNKGKKKEYIAGLLMFVVLSAIILSSVLKQVSGNETLNFLKAIALALLFIFLTTAISYAYKGILLQFQVEKVKRQQVEAELKLLQSQVNPHFLFNTLNNIYAQNLINQEEANDMILQLSDLMRYQTQSSSKNEVPLEEEIEFLENYIALEKKRLTDKTTVSFVVDIPQNTTVMLPPMLFIPFVENAFKHGIGTEGVNNIDIHLQIVDNHVVFDIKNAIPTRKQAVKSTKTGLENIKKRLALLFPDTHNLDVIMENQAYRVQLKIEL